ncbi:MAG: hypothetical protein ACI8UO_004682 [Verrucomicrobiales bacterium]|jgi:hypothetical protein
MALYDSGETWDRGARWDEVAPPSIKPKGNMAKVKLNLRAKSDAELKTFGEGHDESMTGNPNFPTPEPDGVGFATVLSDYSTKLAAKSVADATAKAATAAKDAARIEFEDALNVRGRYVDTASGGDLEKILSSGFESRAPATPIGNLPAPIDFLATMGDMPGEIDLTWSRVTGASTYMVECRENLPEAQWELIKPVTPSKATVPNLVSGTEYAFRVAGVGAAGQGPWSDISVKMAP